MNKRQKKERLKRLNMTKDELAAQRRLEAERTHLAHLACVAARARVRRRETTATRWRKRAADRELRAQSVPKTCTGEW